MERCNNFISSCSLNHVLENIASLLVSQLFYITIMSVLGIPYHIHVTTGDVRNSSTGARVYVIMHGGEQGMVNSGKLWLTNGEKANFQRGRTDIFTVETTEMLFPVHHLTVGHDNSGLGAGWFLERVRST